MKTKILIVQNTIMHYRVPLYRALSEYYKVTILHSGNVSWDQEPFQEIITGAKKIGPLWFQNDVLKQVKSKSYSAVILMNDIRWVNSNLVCFKELNARLILWGHRYSQNGIANRFRNYLMKKVDAILVYGDSEIEKMISAGVKREKIFIANNTIHVPNASFDPDHKKTSFLFVGRAQKRKRINELINSFKEVLDKIPYWTIIEIVGNGDENKILRQQAEQLGIEDRVVFHGAITNPEKLKEIFQRAIAYISPGPVGLGVLHSFAYGVPVVTLSEGKHGPEFQNLINNENAIIYNDPEDLGSILYELSTSELGINLGRKAFDLYSNKLTIKHMVNGFIRAIKNDKDR